MNLILFIDPSGVNSNQENNGFWSYISSPESAQVVIPIAIFLAGVLVQILFFTIKNLMERKNTRDVVYSSIDQLVEQLKQQSNSYRKTAQSLNFESEPAFEFKRSTVSANSVLHEIGYYNSHRAFLSGIENFLRFHRKKRAKAFQRVFSIVEQIKFWHERSYTDMDKFIGEYNAYNEKRNEAVEHFRKYMERYQLANPVAPTKEIKDFIESIDIVRADHQKLTNRTRPDIIQHRLVAPIMKIIQKANGNPPESLIIGDILSHADYQFTNLNNLLSTKRDQFKTYKSLFNGFQQQLINALEILRSKFPRSIELMEMQQSDSQN